jgi:hypothetical protein
MVDQQEALEIISRASEAELRIRIGGILLDVAEIVFQPDREAIVLSVLPEDELEVLISPNRERHCAELLRDVCAEAAPRVGDARSWAVPG